MPLDFLKQLLEREGALVEQVGVVALEAVVPEITRSALGLSDEAPVLALDGRAGSVACGYGTELLRAACARAIGHGQVAAQRASVPTSRPGPLAVFAGLNVALRPGEPAPGEVWTLTAKLRVDASADDRRVLAAEATVALEPSPVAIPRLDWRGVDLEPTGERPSDAALAALEAVLARAGRAVALDVTAPFRESVARRARRDVERIDRYFAELDEDLGSRIKKAGKNVEALAAKRGLLPGERERRLRALRENALVRVRVEPVALLLVVARTVRAPLEVLRRKARRTLSVAWHPVLRSWLPLACEGCGAAVRAFGACDDAVHVLCEACLRAKDCPRCARRGPEVAVLHEERAAVEETVEVAALGDGSPLAGDRVAAVAAPGESVARPSAVVSEKLAVRAKTVAAAKVAPPSQPLSASALRPQRPHREVARGRNELTETLVEVLRSGAEALTSEQLQARCDVFSTEELRNALARLVRDGRVERTGKARGTSYRWLGETR